MAASDNGDEKSDMEEQEEALVALIEHRTKEVEHLRMRLEESEKKLKETQGQLARLRSRNCAPYTRLAVKSKKVKEEISGSPLKITKDSFYNLSDGSSESSSDSYQKACLKTLKTKPKPLLVIPGMNPKVSPPLKTTEYGKSSSERKGLVKEKGFGLLPKQETAKSQTRGTKRKYEENENIDLSQMICSRSSPCTINCDTSNHIPSQHKRKLRSLVLCPTNDQLFVTRSHANLISITPQRQLRLFDIRMKHTEIHEFGWKQESSMSQSALISQAWSPDGLYLTSGSADPVIHIFDIRFNANQPSQSIKAHQKRVFKAAWHHSLPLLISISSDLSIGLHRIT
ncbi:hypothetical protein L1887_10558 [Cichorium endivia]|nr:hypothetical protein L1887_10558 [Cichorium endivia]